MKIESVPVPITFPRVKSEFVLQDISHEDAKNEAVLSADVFDEGDRMLNTDVDTEDSSECNYSAEELNSEVAVKRESMWLVEEEDMSPAHVSDEGVVSAANCDEINEELKTEIDVEENCILGDSSEFIRICKMAGEADVLENEDIIISSTDKLEVDEGCMLEYEEQVTVNVDKNREREISTTKYSRNVRKSKYGLPSETEYKCDICEKCFKTYSSIVQHIRFHTLGKAFKCKVCNKCFTQSRILKTHMKLRTGEKPFKCKECSKCFTQFGKLKIHMGLHSGEKSFKCKECNKCFTRHDYLKRHVKTHTGEKPFKCTECSKCFNRSDNLKEHLLTHTGEKPFKCKECSKCFARHCDLKNHARTHTGEKPFKCKACSKCFARHDHLKRHVRTHT